MLLSCAWGKDNEDRALNAYKQERHEREHSNLEVTMSGLVINPEYSWLGASQDGVVFDPGLLILRDYLKSNALIITVTASQKRFVVSWKRVRRTPLLLSGARTDGYLL